MQLNILLGDVNSLRVQLFTHGADGLKSSASAYLMVFSLCLIEAIERRLFYFSLLTNLND